MAQPPVLSNYPRLFSLLRADPIANNEFQALLSSVRRPQASPNAGLREQLDEVQAQAKALQVKHDAQSKQQAKLTRFIRLLGEVVEGQTHFHPYSQDIAENRKYNITFSPAQIRMLLHAFWDVVGEDMEKQISRTQDPAAAREEEG